MRSPIWVYLYVGDGSLECFILLQMLDQCMAMAKMMVGFKTDQRNAFILFGQVKQLFNFGFLLR